jgi:polysaccharide biosynthesis protein PslG
MKLQFKLLILLLVVPVFSYVFIAKPFVTAAPVTVAGTPGIAAGGGIQYMNSAELAAYLDGLKAVHAKWVRFDFAWSNIQSSSPGVSDWAKYDAVVAAANARDIQVLGMIGYTPSWARPAGCTDDKCRPNDPDQYATFVGQVVSRYKSQGVKHWEIWNEPNINTFWKPAPNAAQYAAILRPAYLAAKAADSTSFILNGGFSPAETNGTNIAPIDFLSGMYAAGAKDHFDALSHHPYCYAGTFDCPSTYAPWSAWSQMEETPTNLRGIMTSNGDAAKKIWITEFGAPTSGSGAVSNAQQGTMLRDAFAIFKTKSWAGPLFWYSYQDTGTDTGDREQWFGMLNFSGVQKPAYAAYLALYVPPPTETPPTPPAPPAPTAPTPTPTTTPVSKTNGSTTTVSEDGTKIETITNADGTTTITATKPDGSSETTVVGKDNKVINSSEKLDDGSVADANSAPSTTSVGTKIAFISLSLIAAITIAGFFSRSTLRKLMSR